MQMQYQANEVDLFTIHNEKKNHSFSFLVGIVVVIFKIDCILKFGIVQIIFVSIFLFIYFAKQLLEHTGTYHSPSQMAIAHSTDSYVNAKYEILCLTFE